MQSITDLDLFELTISGKDFSHDPDTYMLAAKKRHSWLAKSEYGYVVTDYDAFADLLGNDKQLVFSSDHLVQIMGAEGTAWGRFQLNHMLTKSGADHQRLRSSISKAFMPRSVQSYHDRIRNVVNGLLDEWAPKGSFDFTEFAANFPVAVMFGLLGADPARIAEIKPALEGASENLSLNRAAFPRASKAFDDLWDFIDRLINERKARGNPGEPDLLDSVITAETEGKLTDIEVRDMLFFIIVAGYDTSKGQLTQIINLLVDRPELWQRCAMERPFCDKVMDEAFRHTGVGTTYRNAREDFEYRGILFPKGTMLIFPLSTICRYSDKFEDATRFDPDRSGPTRHLIFGRGPHTCLGQFLARLQIGEGLHLITRRLVNPRRAGDVIWRSYPGTWGPRYLPIAFDPVTGAGQQH